MKKNFETHTWNILGTGENNPYTFNYVCKKCYMQFYSNFTRSSLTFKVMPSCEEFINECNVKDILL